jgi:hypothetical protein
MPLSGNARAGTSSGIRGETTARVRPRPPLLRALGRSEPPGSLEIGGRAFRLVRVFKHDSWAATALYEGDTGQVVCKLNRVQPIGPIPMRWLGRKLARNERAALTRLGGEPGIPRWSGDVRDGERALTNAVAHEFVPGRPLGRESLVSDDFFPALRRLLDVMHARSMAYVDLHKRENVLIGDDGRPYLIDFQISVVASGSWLSRSWPYRRILRVLQGCDDYHFLKLQARTRPDLIPDAEARIEASRPFWIKAHRLIARPFRSIRRRFLSRLKVRDARGRAASEVFAEEAVRLDAAGEPRGPHGSAAA